MSLINVSDIICDTKCMQNDFLKDSYNNYNAVKLQLENEVDNSKSYSAVTSSEKNENITNKFNMSISNIESKIKTYKRNIDNSNKDLELYYLYYNKNNDLISVLNDNNTKTLTNDRNSYYENESSTIKTFYNKYLPYVYILIVILFFLILYLVGTGLTLFVNFVLLILFIIFPIIFYYISKSLHYIFVKDNSNLNNLTRPH